MRVSLDIVQPIKSTKGPDYVPAFDRQAAMKLATECYNAPTLPDAIKAIYSAAKAMTNKSTTWKECLYRLGDSLYDGVPHTAIFTLSGNTKLPFASFSTLPVLSCPGAGECADWCYSFRAWRYPGAFCRQLMNALLLKFHPEVIREAWTNLPENITVRLYVDGDFDSYETVKFWFFLCRERPDLQVYGYSKSWDEIYDYGRKYKNTYPKNYTLNLSSGGRTRRISKEAMLKLPITRGYFVSVPIDYHPEQYKGGFVRFADKAYHDAVRLSGERQFGKKVFSCPGECGSCCGGNHACGNRKFDDVIIVIGIH